MQKSVSIGRGCLSHRAFSDWYVVLAIDVLVVLTVTDTVCMCDCYTKAFDVDISRLSCGADHLCQFIIEWFGFDSVVCWMYCVTDMIDMVYEQFVAASACWQLARGVSGSSTVDPLSCATDWCQCLLGTHWERLQQWRLESSFLCRLVHFLRHFLVVLLRWLVERAICDKSH